MFPTRRIGGRPASRWSPRAFARCRRAIRTGTRAAGRSKTSMAIAWSFRMRPGRNEAWTKVADDERLEGSGAGGGDFRLIALDQSACAARIEAHDAGWSSWQLARLITSRSQVRILSPP